MCVLVIARDARHAAPVFNQADSTGAGMNFALGLIGCRRLIADTRVMYSGHFA